MSMMYDPTDPRNRPGMMPPGGAPGGAPSMGSPGMMPPGGMPGMMPPGGMAGPSGAAQGAQGILGGLKSAAMQGLGNLGGGLQNALMGQPSLQMTPGQSVGQFNGQDIMSAPTLSQTGPRQGGLLADLGNNVANHFRNTNAYKLGSKVASYF